MALTLPPATRRAFERVAADVTRVFDRRLVAFVASGPASGVVFVSRIQSGDLDALGALAETWHRDGLDTPLLLTTDEFARSLDAFPLEYQTLVDHHVVIAGTPPFAAMLLPREYLRHACEAAAKGHLIYVRQGWIDAAGHTDRLGRLLVESAGPLRSLLGNVARLQGQENAGAADQAAAALAGARVAGLDDGLVSAVLALESSPASATSLVPRLPEYLTLAERLWAFVDEWRP